MAKLLFLATILTLAGATAAWAQSNGGAPSETGGAGVRSDHITSTGATVPNPGASQSGGVTPLDKGIQHEDTKIQSSICKGC